QDFRGLSQLDFVDYSIGNWECKCGNLKGLHHLRATCRNCGASVVTNPYKTGDVICTKCGTFNKNTPTFCNKCGDPVAMQLKYDVNECQERGMTYSAPLKVTIRLTVYDKDPDTVAKNILYVRIDRKRKFLGSIFLRALGMKSNEEILRTFYQVERITLRERELFWNVSEGLIDRKLSHEIKHPRTDEVLVGAHKRLTE